MNIKVSQGWGVNLKNRNFLIDAAVSLNVYPPCRCAVIELIRLGPVRIRGIIPRWRDRKQ